MQILNSLEGLTGKGVGAVVVTASPENAKQLAEMLTAAGVGCDFTEGDSIVTVNPPRGPLGDRHPRGPS